MDLEKVNLISTTTMEITTKSAAETQKVAVNLVKKIIKDGVYPKHLQSAVVVALEGELGAGKTTFVQGFAKELGIKHHITSPTFLLIKNYKLKIKNYENLVHIDAYRLKDHKDLEKLNIKEMLSDSKNIILIEWSDRVKKVLPKNYIKIHIDHIAETERLIRVMNYDS